VVLISATVLNNLQVHSAAAIIRSIKKSGDVSGNRTHDLNCIQRNSFQGVNTTERCRTMLLEKPTTELVFKKLPLFL
jgi:exopolyphosphatase/pppGpp-phosphohydrolase